MPTNTGCMTGCLGPSNRAAKLVDVKVSNDLEWRYYFRNDGVVVLKIGNVNFTFWSHKLTHSKRGRPE